MGDSVISEAGVGGNDVGTTTFSSLLQPISSTLRRPFFYGHRNSMGRERDKKIQQQMQMPINPHNDEAADNTVPIAPYCSNYEGLTGGSGLLSAEVANSMHTSLIKQLQHQQSQVQRLQQQRAQLKPIPQMTIQMYYGPSRDKPRPLMNHHQQPILPPSPIVHPANRRNDESTLTLGVAPLTFDSATNTSACGGAIDDPAGISAASIPNNVDPISGADGTSNCWRQPSRSNRKLVPTRRGRQARHTKNSLGATLPGRKDATTPPRAAQQALSPVPLISDLSSPGRRAKDDLASRGGGRKSSASPAVRMCQGKRVTMIDEKLKVFVIDLLRPDMCDLVRRMVSYLNILYG